MVISDRTKSQLFENDQQIIRIALGSATVGATARKKPNKNGTPWSAEEHERFLLALERFPSGPWKIIASYVMTRTTRQTMTHAQKYREKIVRMKRSIEESSLVQPLGSRSPRSEPFSPMYTQPRVISTVAATMSGSHRVAPEMEFNVEDGGFLLSCSEIDEMFNATLLTLLDLDEPSMIQISAGVRTRVALGDEAMSVGVGHELRSEPTTC